jgi:hypothetical protein
VRSLRFGTILTLRRPLDALVGYRYARNVLTLCSGQDEPRGSAVAAAESLVLDDVQPLLPELRQMVQHPPNHVGAVPLPVLDLADDSKRLPGAVGLRGLLAVENRCTLVIHDDNAI